MNTVIRKDVVKINLKNQNKNQNTNLGSKNQNTNLDYLLVYHKYKDIGF